MKTPSPPPSEPILPASAVQAADADAPAGMSQDSGVLSQTCYCVGCGYNLRGLNTAGDCPECGRTIAESLGTHLPFHRSASLARRAQHALIEFIVAVALGLLLCFLKVVSDGSVSVPLRFHPEPLLAKAMILEHLLWCVLAITLGGLCERDHLGRR